MRLKPVLAVVWIALVGSSLLSCASAKRYPLTYPVIELPELVGVFISETVEMRYASGWRLNDVGSKLNLDSLNGPPPNQIVDFRLNVIPIGDTGYIIVKMETPFCAAPGMGRLFIR